MVQNTHAAVSFAGVATKPQRQCDETVPARLNARILGERGSFAPWNSTSERSNIARRPRRICLFLAQLGSHGRRRRPVSGVDLPGCAGGLRKRCLDHPQCRLPGTHPGSCAPISVALRRSRRAGLAEHKPAQAPRGKRRFQAPHYLREAAPCRKLNAVLPSVWLAFTSAFAASKACTTSRWPCCAAYVSAATGRRP